MIFGSFERIEVNGNEELDIYNDVICEENMECLINKKCLKIADTNIPIFRSKTAHLDFQSNFKFVVFKKSEEFEEDFSSYEHPVESFSH